jgi:hypothetical protein
MLLVRMIILLPGGCLIIQRCEYSYVPFRNTLRYVKVGYEKQFFPKRVFFRMNIIPLFQDGNEIKNRSTLFLF